MKDLICLVRTHLNREIILVTGLMAVGAYLYLTGLSQIMALEADENRVYHFTIFAPLLYMGSSMFTHAFKSFDAPYYMMGALAWMNVLLIYLGVRKILGKSIAFWAALFYMTYDFVFSLSKFMVYSTVIVFFILIYAHIIWIAIKKQSPWIGFFGGMVFSMMFYTNASSYAPIAALSVVTLLAWLWHGEKDPWKVVRLFVWMASGFILSSLILEYFIWIRYHGIFKNVNFPLYWNTLFEYRKLPGCIGPKGVMAIFRSVLNKEFLQTAGSGLRSILLLLFMFFGVIRGIRARNKVLALIGWFGMIAFGLMLAGGYWSIHVFHRKPLAFIAIPIVIYASFGAFALLQARSRWGRYLSRLLVVLYVILSTIQCVEIKSALPSFGPIEKYLRDHGIKKGEIVTLLPINNYADYIERRTTINLPTILSPFKYDFDRELYLVIFWPNIYYLYLKGKTKYYLSSGVMSDANVGSHDIFLRGVRPIAVFDNHPLNNPYFNDYPSNYRIKLYDLKDIFSKKENVASIRNVIQKMVSSR